MRVILSATTDVNHLSNEIGYTHLKQLAKLIGNSMEINDWFLLPSNARESKLSWPALSNEKEFLLKIEKNHALDLKKWPDSPNNFYAFISNKKDEAGYKDSDTVDLHYDINNGLISLKIRDIRVLKTEKSATSIVKSSLRSIVDSEWISFASVDVESPIRREGLWNENYMMDHRTFPHRQFLGWMGWVQRLPPAKPLTAEDIPQAAEVIPMPGRCGSLIVAVDETFDLGNPEHIKRAQQVEMRLADLDALPVIDPAFM